MSYKHRRKSAGPLARIGGAVGALLCLGLLYAGPASAAYEQVGCFAGGTPADHCAKVAEEKFSEEVQLGGVAGMAVNRSGAGGVAKGTVYAATRSEGIVRVAMFEPAGEGLKFLASWEVTAFEEPYKRCGPLLGVDGEGNANVPCAPRPRGDVGQVDVEVDQESGNLYVFDGVHTAGGQDDIIEYKADGSAVITRFGPQAPDGESTAESPGKIHWTSAEMGPLAVNSSGAGGVAKGTVYLADEVRGLSPYHRLMAFEPQSPGDYAHYVYAGEVIAAPTGYKQWGPVSDDAGNFYLVGEERTIEEFAPQAPSAYPASPVTPICEYAFEPGGITGLTVDPVSGEVFFFSYKKPKRLRRLGPCSPITHEFAESGAGEVETIEVSPERDDLWGLAFDPARKPSGRPAGVLYGGAPSGKSSVGNGEPDQGALGYLFAHPKEIPPALEGESVSRVTAASAQLGATLDPEGFETHYFFQYISAAGYEANPPGERFAGAGEAPPGGAEVEGAGPRRIGAPIAGLLPDTAYRYRAVATSNCSEGEPSKVCETDGGVGELRTYPTGTNELPDQRAWELVSPAQKHGGQVLPAEPRIASCPAECKPGATFNRFPLQSSPGGDAIAYEGTPFGEEGAAIENAYLSDRTEAGWQTTNITPPLLLTKAGSYRSYAAGFGSAVLEQRSPALSPEAPEGYAELYIQPRSDPLALEPLIRVQPPSRTAEQFELRFAGASADGSRVFFAGNDALTLAEVPGIAPAAPPVAASEFDLYEWHAGQLALVNVLPGNAAAAAGSSFGVSSAQTISTAGDRAFWTSASGQLYVRVDGDETRQLSKSQRSVADPLGPLPATFLGASVDGTRALFSSSEELTDDANTGLGEEIVISASAGTYTLTFASQTTAPLAFNASAAQVQAALEALSSIGNGNVAVAAGKEGNAVRLNGSLASSQEPISVDGSGLTGTVVLHPFRPGRDLYEWQEGALTDLSAGQGSYAFQGIVGQGQDLARVFFVDTAVLDEAANEAGEVAEADKFNLYAFSEGGGARFVARLAAGDNGGFFGGDWETAPSNRTGEASPSGRYLAFLSRAPLTGYDNTGPGGSAVKEAFLYDAEADELVCASCNRSGAAPLGSSVLRLLASGADLSQPRYLTDAGRLFFDSQDSLSPADTNEGVEDVYEYEPAGVGSCERAGGCVTLISAGREGGDSNFLAMDETGKNAFFTTRDRLVEADGDQLIDLYDSREGGGFASEHELPPGGCQGEACQPVPAAPPEPPPATSTFAGSGNYKPAKKTCGKGKVKRKGHCVKKHSAKKHSRHKQATHRHGGGK